MIRLHLKCASIVWDPYLNKDIDAIEKVQKFPALKILQANGTTFSYRPLLDLLNAPILWPTGDQKPTCVLCLTFFTAL